MDTPSTYDPTFDRHRELTDQETENIRSEEGLRPAFEVAEDFNTEIWRVRTIWRSREHEE